MGAFSFYLLVLAAGQAREPGALFFGRGPLRPGQQLGVLGCQRVHMVAQPGFALFGVVALLRFAVQALLEGLHFLQQHVMPLLQLRETGRNRVAGNLAIRAGRREVREHAQGFDQLHVGLALRIAAYAQFAFVEVGLAQGLHADSSAARHVGERETGGWVWHGDLGGIEATGGNQGNNRRFAAQYMDRRRLCKSIACACPRPGYDGPCGSRVSLSLLPMVEAGNKENP